MTKEELRQEMLEDDAREVRQELEEEHKCRSDYDYAIDKLGISRNMTVEEFAYAVRTLNEWGWEITICDAIDDLL